jgi:enolase
MYIEEVSVGFVKDSRGSKSVFFKIKTIHGEFKASAPSGKSVGSNEVSAYNAAGKSKSLTLLKNFGTFIKHKNFRIKNLSDLQLVVRLIKKFESEFGQLGGNCCYVIESAFLKAAAAESKKELWKFIWDSMDLGKQPKMPMPVGNCIGGGLHSKAKHKVPDFQEFLLIPKEKTFHHAITVNIRAYDYARKLLKAKRKNDESAWITQKSNQEVLDVMLEVSRRYGLFIGLDVAANSFFKDKYYQYNNKKLTRDRLDQIDFIERIIKKYRIFYMEDPLQEGDFSGFKQILNSTKNNNFSTLVVGDDLTTTNYERLRRAIRSGSINALIVKPNQIGSLLEVSRVVQLAKKEGVKIIFSHRSGETMDVGLADYAVGFGADFVKMGIMGRERLVKHKRLIEIEKSLLKSR